MINSGAKCGARLLSHHLSCFYRQSLKISQCFSFALGCMSDRTDGFRSHGIWTAGRTRAGGVTRIGPWQRGGLGFRIQISNRHGIQDSNFKQGRIQYSNFKWVGFRIQIMSSRALKITINGVVIVARVTMRGFSVPVMENFIPDSMVWDAITTKHD